MKIRFLLLLFLSIFLIQGCGKKEEIPEGMHKVEVVETMNASSYTYMKVSENGEEYWIAVPQQQVKKGDIYYFTKSLEMKNFSSGSLNRTFDRILFVEDISKTSSPSMPGSDGMNPHGQIMSGKQNIKVEPVADGHTVENVYKDKDMLSGKEIIIRGIVTKYNPGILGRNWVHIQDGSGFGDNYDLIITTNDETEEGRTVLVKGVVALNKDFGNGYAYSVLLENASIKSE